MTKDDIIESLVNKVENWDMGNLVGYVMQGMETHYKAMGNSELIETYNEENCLEEGEAGYIGKLSILK